MSRVNVGVYQKQELFLEFNVCVSQKQGPKPLVLLYKGIQHKIQHFKGQGNSLYHKCVHK